MEILWKKCVLILIASPKPDSIYDSDYEPFEKRGYVAIDSYDGLC